MVFETLLDPFLRPLLALSPFWAVFIIAFVLTLAITFVYKYTTNQKRMLELRTKLKAMQKKMKAARDDPKKLMKIQQESMSLNMELMKHSFKPTLYTFIPIIIIFGWLNAHMAYYNLAPQQDFTLTATFNQGIKQAELTVIPPENISIAPNATVAVVNDTASWTLRGDPGLYKATVTVPNAGSQEKAFLITDERRYEPPMRRYKDSAITSIALSNEHVKPLNGISLLGWRPGWLGTYIILSLILSILLRKLLKVV